MSLSVTALANELYDLTKWQKTPEPLTADDYEQFIIYGIKKLFVDTGRASAYNTELFMKDEETEEVTMEYELLVDEELYVMLVAQIRFFQRVAVDVNRMVGYTTNALSITNADKPYANISDSINKLENERRITYYKMVRYTM